MWTVTSGCFEDPAGAVHHGARHGESVKPQFVAGEHRFNPHGGRLPPPSRSGGIQTWERERGEGRKPGVRAHLSSYPSNTVTCCWSSAALLYGLPWRMVAKRRWCHLGLNAGAERGRGGRGCCWTPPGARFWGQLSLVSPASCVHPSAERCSGIPAARDGVLMSLLIPGWILGGARRCPCWRGHDGMSLPPLPTLGCCSPSPGILPNLELLGVSEIPAVPNCPQPRALGPRRHGWAPLPPPPSNIVRAQGMQLALG